MGLPSGWVTVIAEWSATLIEGVGIALIVILSLYALLYGVWQRLRGGARGAVYHEIRQRLGHGILLGLEFLVAADIIHTVAVELTFTTVGVLGAVVLIRTFLSFTLELELTGRWPWQPRPETSSAPPADG
ncbi:MAG: DUF1622 domain-containing protein [Myxococcales bacterium]|nr:DUF1622 domain-containing protein [Myxococcales bacterium]MCB9541981.1 DUF1622 domain-containing protein [Myxococcales bacterium]